MQIPAEWIYAVVAALAATVVALWRVISKYMARQDSEIDRLRGIQGDAADKVTALTGKVAKIEGEREGHMRGIEELSGKVLEEVRSLKE